jgi:transcriptional regulator with XRE-family HTH domain
MRRVIKNMVLPTKPIKTEELAASLKRLRRERGLTLRECGRQMGISASTLSRVERDIGKPDAEVLVRLSSWLNIPLERIIDCCDEACPVVFFETESTPDIVEAHLMQDARLTRERAKALSALFREAYRQYRVNQNV